MCIRDRNTAVQCQYALILTRDLISRHAQKFKGFSIVNQLIECCASVSVGVAACAYQSLVSAVHYFEPQDMLKFMIEYLEANTSEPPSLDKLVPTMQLDSILDVQQSIQEYKPCKQSIALEFMEKVIRKTEMSTSAAEAVANVCIKVSIYSAILMKGIALQRHSY